MVKATVNTADSTERGLELTGNGEPFTGMSPPPALMLNAETLLDPKLAT
jgi:hypothetical protein